MLTELQQKMFLATLLAAQESVEDRKILYDKRYDRVLEKVSSYTFENPISDVDMRIMHESRGYAEAYNNASWILNDLINQFKRLERSNGV